jgi:hypothetical protein
MRADGLRAGGRRAAVIRLDKFKGRAVMVATNIRRFAFGVLSLTGFLAYSATAAAQTTVPVLFDRTGEPGIQQLTQVDPLDPTQTITVTVPTGAFVNPCTFEYVDVTGSSVIQSTQTVDSKGLFMKVTVKVVTKGTGLGVSDNDGDFTNGGYTANFTGSTYSFTETQTFSFKVPVDLLSSEEFTSDFSDKISMKGAKSLDNWTIRSIIRIKVNSSGVTTGEVIRMDADGVCKG